MYLFIYLLFRCWEEIIESPIWWIIKTPILVSILVKYQRILKAIFNTKWGGRGEGRIEVP